MGFIREIYSENRAGLVVSFTGGENTTTFFSGDSVAEAMKYFNVYEKNGTLYRKTEDSQALQEIGISNTEATDFRVAVDSLIQNMTDEEAIVLWPEVKKFVTVLKREPDIDSADPKEKRLAEALLYLRRARREASHG